MKIRTLIKKLQKMEEKYGNLTVHTINSMYNDETDEDLTTPVAAVGTFHGDTRNLDKVTRIDILDYETAISLS